MDWHEIEMREMQEDRVRDVIDDLRDKLAKAERERDEARAALHRIAKVAGPIVDELWETGKHKTSEVIKLGELVQMAIPRPKTQLNPNP